MSLDCYPLGKRRAIDLSEQPIALDVAYNDNLLVSVTDQCQHIVVYDLVAEENNSEKFSLGEDVVIDQIVYCQTGDYLACVGHKNGILSIYTIFNWRKTSGAPVITELDLNGDEERNLFGIDCCQRTGNLAASCGDRVYIHQYVGDNDSIRPHFRHIISIKLTIWALKICLLENYLSIMAVDHVQVLKLELLTLQIQSDALDAETQQLNGVTLAAHVSETSSTTEATTVSSSLLMDSTSNSTATNFSSFASNNNNNDDDIINYNHASENLNNSDVSIITMNQQTNNLDLVSELLQGGDSNQSADDCITWNLNTKKLVKLPTLMHNTSTSLSSYHICHPLELLGPASESIACRVSASIYSPDYCQNQLEAVVMLCKQFDLDLGPVKSSHMQAIYLASQDDQVRLSKGAFSATAVNVNDQQQQASSNESDGLLKSSEHDLLASVTYFVSTLASCFVYSLHGKKVVRTQIITHPDLCLDMRPDLLNVYLLTSLGLQICSSGICDSTLRYDWSSSSDLNLSFLATKRTRVLTTASFIILVAGSVNGKCMVEYMEKPGLDSLFERIVHTVKRCNSISVRSNLLTYLHATAQLKLLAGRQDESGALNQGAPMAPTTTDEHRRRTTDGQMEEKEKACQANGIATVVSVLKSVTIMLCKQLLQKKQTNVITNVRIDRAIKHLLDISMCDIRELMDRHLRAYAGLQRDANLVARNQINEPGGSRSQRNEGFDNESLVKLEAEETGSGDDNNNEPPEEQLGEQEELSSGSSWSSQSHLPLTFGADDELLDTDFELLKIYLKHAKFSQSLLDYLVSESESEPVSERIISYLFEHNPRLLIKCAQRYPLNGKGEPVAATEVGDSKADRKAATCVPLILVAKLKQLAEFDSTGINRATVLFTLAILYNALEEKQKCLATLSQIKPQNHLAITMCSNYELSRSIAGLVSEHYPDVFSLFLIQLAKRDKLAAREFAAGAAVKFASSGASKVSASSSPAVATNITLQPGERAKEEEDEEAEALLQSPRTWRKMAIHHRRRPRAEQEDDGTDDKDDKRQNKEPNENENHNNAGCQSDDDDDLDADAAAGDEDEGELFERKLKLVAEIPTMDLVELLAELQLESQASGEEEEEEAKVKGSFEKSAEQALLEASINLLESQFILARLRENS